jgi:hypothetical protein
LRSLGSVLRHVVGDTASRWVVVALLVAFETACPGASNGDQQDQEGASQPSAARLRELGLTRAIPGQVRTACDEARRLASVRVLCPTLIPDTPITKIEGLWGSIVLDAEPRFYMLSFNNGDPPGAGRHWIVGSGLAPVVEKWVLSDFANEVKGEPRLVRRVDRGNRVVLVYRFPEFPAGGPNGGHWAAFVRVGDETVFASLHGKRYVEAAVETALALADQADSSPP